MGSPSRSLSRRILAASNPPSLRPVRRQAPIMDASPHRNRHLSPAPDATPQMMNQAIAMAVEFGMPRRLAEEARTNPYEPRHAVYFLAAHIMEASAGVAESRRVLERVREGLVNAGAVSEAFAAYEQPASGQELKQLLGLD